MRDGDAEDIFIGPLMEGKVPIASAPRPQVPASGLRPLDDGPLRHLLDGGLPLARAFNMCTNSCISLSLPCVKAPEAPARGMGLGR